MVIIYTWEEDDWVIFHAIYMLGCCFTLFQHFKSFEILNRNLPLQDLIEKLSKGELSKEDYPCLNDPNPTFHGMSPGASVQQQPVAHSMRSRRTPTWARPRGSDDGYSRYYFLRLFVLLG